MPIPEEAASSPLKLLTTAELSGGEGGIVASAGSGVPSPSSSAGFQALSDNGTTYNPDTQGAVGPDHVMTTLSSQIRIQSRNGDQVSTFSLDSFWSDLGSPEIFDPRVTYDPFAQRWIHIGTANFNVNPGLVVAVSQTSNPTNAWNRYFIDVDVTNPVFAQSPNVGFNKNWIVVQANMFNNTNFSFVSSDIFAFNKANLYANGPGTFTKFSFDINQFGGPVNAQVPAQTYDNALNTLFLLGHYNHNFGNFGYLRLYRITGTPNAPVFESPDIYPATPTPTPWDPYPFEINSLPQAGTTNKVNAGDARLQNVIYRNGSLWTTHTVFLPADDPTRAAVQWWEVLPNTGGAFQFGRIDDVGGGRSFAYPSIAVNARNDVLLGYSSFGPAQFPSASYSFKTDQDTPGQLRDSAILKTGEASYYVPNGEFNTWGDWSATVVDPVNDIDMWTLQEYAAAPGDFWSTWWGRISPPVDLVLTMSGSPGSILAGQNVTYSLSVTNKDYGKPASGLKLTDTLPAGVLYVSGTTSQGSGCAESGGVVVCDLGNLAENAFATATITLKLNASGTVNNTVTASANGPEMQPTDNSRAVSTSVTPAVDLAVIQSGTPNPAQQGNTITYSIQVTNRGPSTATTVKMTNTLPSILTYQSSSTTLGSCSFSAGIVTCTLGTLAPQTAATIAINAIAAAGGSASNQAKVGSTVIEINPTDNTQTSLISVNARPTLQSISNRAIDEDTGTGDIAFTVGDAETPADQLLVTATSSNPALLPNGNVILGGSGPNRTISLLPLPDQFGSTMITRTVSDGNGGTNTATFTLTVNPVNDRPTISSISSRSIDEDTTTGAIAFTIGDIETAPGSLTLTRNSSNTSLVPVANIVLGGSDANRSVTVTPAANQFGTATISVMVSDGALTATNQFVLTVNSVNDLPTITAISNRSVNEDTPTPAIAFTIGDVETAADSLTLTGASSNTQLVPTGNIVFGGSGSGRTVTVTPMQDQFGDVSITVTVRDAHAGQTNTAFVLTITPVNDPPTLTSIGNVVVDEDTGAFTVNLSGIAAGPSNESQPLTVAATSDNTGIISNPTVTYTSPNTQGTLTFTTLPDVHGAATITVTVDDNQSANHTLQRTFNITVNPVNDPPTVSTIANQTIDEDSSTGPIAFQIGDVETPVNNLSLSMASSDTTLVPTDRIVFSGTGATRFVTVTPAPDQFGSANIQVIAGDGTNQTQMTFTLTVNPVNDPPSISTVADRSVNEDTSTGPISIIVSDLETPLDNLKISATSSVPAVVPQENITFGGTGPNRTVSIQPAPDQSGTVLITLTLTDGDQASVQTTFTLSVTAVNDVPTLNAIGDLERDEDAGPVVVNLAGIGSGAPNENQTLTVTATSSDPAKIPHPAVVYLSPNPAGTLTLSPLTNATGEVTITVQVNDGGSVNNTTSRAFKVTLNPINDPPFLSTIPSQSTDEDIPTAAIAVTIGDVETPVAGLTLTASSSNEEVVSNDGILLGGTGPNRTVIVTPLPEQSGSTFISLFLTDGDGSTTSTGFDLTVRSVNDRPTISPISNQSVDEDSSTPPISFTIGDVETAATSLTVTKDSSDTGLLPVSSIVLGGSGPNWTVTLTPAPNQSGSATVSIIVSDGALNTTNQFVLTVNPVNDPPTLDAIPAQEFYAGSGPQTVGLTGIGSGSVNESQILTVTAVSSDSVLLPDPAVLYATPNATGTLTLAVPAAATGVSTVTVTVMDDGGTDGGGQNSVVRTFQVTIKARPILRVRLEDGMIVLSWPSNHVGFRVEERDQVNNGPWNLNPALPEIEGNEYVVRWLPAAPFKVYRLTDSPSSSANLLKLGIRIKDNEVVLFWPTALNHLILQTRAQAEPEEWETVQVQPVVRGKEYNVTLPRTDRFRIFQLKQPWQ